MCLAIPVQITEVIDADRALASAGGVIREINTALVDKLAAGDYVILHVGYALSRVNEDEAARTLELMERGAALTPGESV
ncbi:MAG: HypC/HybG/HupF family hydrogenase formation chaperone [Pseudomonadota bacterium]